ncbi:hypothetical protein JCM10908_006072 [Rhodotorula pacifica]|uniref:uncharacterized protein n=1 Tax=Rhodotorula pacifica TaxID=1495444 RepID=UPI00316EA90B
MLLRTSLLAAAVLSLAQSVSAQDLGSLMISRECIQGVSNLLGTEFATCASFGNLLPLATTSGSVIDPTIIEGGCAEELGANNVAVVAIRDILANFPAVKEGLCLRQTLSYNGSFCATSILTNVQNALGTDLTLSNLASLNVSNLEELPAQRLCDNCLHAMTTKLLPIFEPNPAESQTGRAMAQYCGSKFLDGQVPDTVQEYSQASATSSSDPAPAASSPVSGAVKVGGSSVAVVALASLFVGLGLL